MDNFYIFERKLVSDIFDALRRSALAHGAQVVKRMDAAVMAVVPIEPDRVVAYALAGRSRLVGGGRSLQRTRLQCAFSLQEGKNREIPSRPSALRRE